MPTDVPDRSEAGTWLRSTLAARLQLFGGIALSALLFNWIAGMFSIPDAPGFSASLLQQPGWFMLLLIVLVCTAAVMLAAGLLASWPRPDAPVLCTAAGMAVLSWRGGPMQYTLFAAGGPSVFVTLAVEVTLLFGILALAWWALQTIQRRTEGKLIPEGPEEPEPQTLDEKFLAFFAHAALMTTLMILLSRTDGKKQALAAVGVSSCVAAVGAYQIVHVRSSFWFWISPLAVALFGYVFTSFNAVGWQTGVLHGAIATLARPLPLDYVSMGPIGAIIGYSLAGGGIVSHGIADTLEPSNGEPAANPQ